MSDPAVSALVDQLAAFPGVKGFTLVEVDTGMVWYRAGSLPDIDIERLGEAAIEFWRIEQRLSAHFEDMGELKSAAYSFSNGIVALFPCCEKPSLIAICITSKLQIAWKDWAVTLAVLKKKLLPTLSPNEVPA